MKSSGFPSTPCFIIALQKFSQITVTQLLRIGNWQGMDLLPADDLLGVLPVAEHDGLVHDHTLGGLRLVAPGDPDDVEVRAVER